MRRAALAVLALVVVTAIVVGARASNPSDAKTKPPKSPKAWVSLIPPISGTNTEAP